ncbi:MAG: hypothetical protein FWE35_02210 [Streptosporangiales bacterium]|nr:hypothetical protein [Streptosporangiales bacterium]
MPTGSSIQLAARRLVSQGRPCHLIWNPATGDTAQLISALRAGCALSTPDPPHESGHVRRTNVNTEGRVCMQIGVLSDEEPFTDGPLTGLASIMNWLDSWKVPRVWPAGKPSSQGRPPRSRALWARGGHFGATQVPGCVTGGPGPIDPARLTGTQLHELRSLDEAVAVPALRRPALKPLARRRARPVTGAGGGAGPRRPGGPGPGGSRRIPGRPR